MRENDDAPTAVADGGHFEHGGAVFGKFEFDSVGAIGFVNEAGLADVTFIEEGLGFDGHGDAGAGDEDLAAGGEVLIASFEVETDGGDLFLSVMAVGLAADEGEDDERRNEIDVEPTSQTLHIRGNLNKAKIKANKYGSPNE